MQLLLEPDKTKESVAASGHRKVAMHIGHFEVELNIPFKCAVSLGTLVPNSRD